MQKMWDSKQSNRPSFSEGNAVIKTIITSLSENTDYSYTTDESATFVVKSASPSLYSVAHEYDELYEEGTGVRCCDQEIDADSHVMIWQKFMIDNVMSMLSCV